MSFFDKFGLLIKRFDFCIFWQKKDKKFLCQLAKDKKYLEKILDQITEQKDTPSKYQGNVQKQVNSITVTVFFVR